MSHKVYVFYFSEIKTTTTSKHVISGGSDVGYKHLDVDGGKTMRHAPDAHKDGHTVGIIIGVLITTVLVVAVVRTPRHQHSCCIGSYGMELYMYVSRLSVITNQVIVQYTFPN